MNTTYYKNKYRVQSARLNGYDYSQNGFYFVTICTNGKICYFGDIIIETQNFASLRLTEIGEIAKQCWLEIPKHFPFVNLDEFIVMPNHLHGILEIKNDKKQQMEYQNKFGPQSKNLSSIIRGFKIGVTKYTNNHNIDFAWQPRFHDRIIRSEDELNRIRQYIINNPLKWELDKNNLENLFM